MSGFAIAVPDFDQVCGKNLNKSTTADKSTAVTFSWE